MARAAALVLFPLFAWASAADTDEPTGEGNAWRYPAAQCAAFWSGYDDYASWSAYLDRDASDVDRAQAFRDVAYRLDGGRTERVDAFVAEQRGLMEIMIEAMIYGGDEQSQEVFERLTETCESFAAEHPETKALK